MSTDSKSTGPDPLARLEAWLGTMEDGREVEFWRGREGFYCDLWQNGPGSIESRSGPTLAAAITAALDAAEVDRG